MITASSDNIATFFHLDKEEVRSSTLHEHGDVEQQPQLYVHGDDAHDDGPFCELLVLRTSLGRYGRLRFQASFGLRGAFRNSVLR